MQSWKPTPATSALLEAGEGKGVSWIDDGSGNHSVPVSQWEPPAVLTKNQREALQHDLAALDARLRQRCSQEWVHRQLARLATLTTVRNSISREQYQIKLQAIAEKISEYPAEVVQAACQRHARECKWFPELAELIKACDAELEPLKTSRARIRLALAKHKERGQRRNWRPPSVEDKEHAAELVQGLRAKLAEEDEAERKRLRSRPIGHQPRRENLPEGPGAQRARLIREGALDADGAPVEGDTQ